MAILKNISIHASGSNGGAVGVSAGLARGVNNVVDYINDPEKNTVITNASDINRVLNYDINDMKTMGEFKGIEKQLVSYIGTSESTVATDFQELMDKYYETHTRRQYKKDASGKSKQEIVAFHFVQSWKESPDQVDPQKIHQAGIDLLNQLGYIGVVSTHMDTDNIHNHILVCPFPENEQDKRLIMNKSTWREACKINDEICKDYGMPTLDQQRPEKGKHKEGQRDGSAVHAEKKARESGKSYKEQLRKDIINAIPKCKSWDDLLAELEKNEWVIKEKGNTVTAVEMSNDKHRVRLDRLGGGFSKQELILTIAHNNDLTKGLGEYAERKIAQELAREIKPRKKNNYHVSQYTSNGRKRSDLTMVILRLIALLKKIRDALIDAITNAKEEQIRKELEAKAERINKQIENLEKQLKKLSKYQNKEELAAAKKEVGKNLNIAKGELAAMKKKDTFNIQVAQLLDQYNLLSRVSEYVKLEFLPEYTKQEIKKEVADRFPATADQKKELFKLLGDKDTEYRVDGKWDTLNYDEAKSIIDFMKGKNEEKPERLIGKYDKTQKETSQNELNENKNDTWIKYLNTLPDDVRQDADKLYHTLSELRKIGIDPEKQDINDLRREIQKHQNEMYEKTHEVEFHKNEYMGIVRIEKAIEKAEETIQNEQEQVREREAERERDDTKENSRHGERSRDDDGR